MDTSSAKASLAITALVLLTVASAGCVSTDKIRLYNQSGDYYDKGHKASQEKRHDEAIQYFEKSIEIAESLKGDARLPTAPDPDAMIATGYKGIAAMHFEKKNYAQAEDYYLRSLKLREKVLGAESVPVADVLNDLGWTYYKQGRFEPAGPLYERAGRIYDKSGSRFRARFAMVVQNQALLAEGLGKQADADLNFKRALEIVETAIGPKPDAKHPGLPILGRYLLQYAAFLRKTGREADAQALERKASALPVKPAPE